MYGNHMGLYGIIYGIMYGYGIIDTGWWFQPTPFLVQFYFQIVVYNHGWLVVYLPSEK